MSRDDPCHTRAQLLTNAAEAILPQTAPPSVSLKRRLITRRVSDLQIEKLEWVWPGRIAAGKLVLIGGPPGLGKSQLTTFISAVVSNGWDWPCGEGSAKAGNVIFMSAEHGIEDAILPRLKAAGAALDGVYIVASATKPDGTGRETFSLGQLLGRVRIFCKPAALSAQTDQRHRSRFANHLPAAKRKDVAAGPERHFAAAVFAMAVPT